MIQELVNYQFDNASTYYTNIEEEIAFGTLEFRTISARINTIIDAKTGQRVNDDYKKLIFQDLTYNPELGSRYRFDDNIWIVFSTDNLRTDTSSVYIRRCNNTINTQDEYGNIHREPCYIDYKVTETQPFREYSLDLPSGRIEVKCQSNDWTSGININDRFMFGGSTYKIRECHRYDGTKIVDGEYFAPLVSFYADYDEVAPDDNRKLEIANYRRFNYDVIFLNEISGNIGDSGKINYFVSLNGSKTNMGVTFESTDNNIIDMRPDGNYTVVGSGECDIVARIENVNDFSKIINFNKSIRKAKSVNGVSNSEYKDILEPDITAIKLNKTQSYNIYEYKNGIAQDTTFDIRCYDAPENNYFFKTDGNNFSITNLKTTNDYLLRVVCTNNRTSEDTTIYIKLGGLF
jgi:hypothetical protein